MNVNRHKLSSIIRQKNMSLEDIAIDAGITPEILERALNGSGAKLGRSQVNSLAAVLRTSVGQITGDWPKIEKEKKKMPRSGWDKNLCSDKQKVYGSTLSLLPRPYGWIYSLVSTDGELLRIGYRQDEGKVWENEAPSMVALVSMVVKLSKPGNIVVEALGSKHLGRDLESSFCSLDLSIRERVSTFQKPVEYVEENEWKRNAKALERARQLLDEVKEGGEHIANEGDLLAATALALSFLDENDSEGQSVGSYSN